MGAYPRKESIKLWTPEILGKHINPKLIKTQKIKLIGSSPRSSPTQARPPSMQTLATTPNPSRRPTSSRQLSQLGFRRRYRRKFAGKSRSGRNFAGDVQTTQLQAFFQISKPKTNSNPIKSSKSSPNHQKSSNPWLK